ncbi:MAG: Hsp20/alpha crystallin family protein [Bacteroidia bacterium]|nr:Hsp20/alpha crystallin family protein [Bacteroidia bacterium]
MSTFPFQSNIFSDFFNDVETSDLFKNTMPAVNIAESETSFNLEVSAPGYNKNDFKIDVDDNTMTISAENQEEIKDENKRYTRKEFRRTEFSRVFTLPESVDLEKIEAKYDNGILNINLPKLDEAKAKKTQNIRVS